MTIVLRVVVPDLKTWEQLGRKMIGQAILHLILSDVSMNRIMGNGVRRVN